MEASQGSGSDCDFFISYTAVDRAWAEWVAWQLEAAGYTVMLQAWDFRPGSNFVLQMRSALDRCNRTLAIISPAYFDSVYAAAEWSAAFTSAGAAGESSLLMVQVSPVQLPRLLRPWVYIDLVDQDEASAVRKLLTGVSRTRAKPIDQPPLPYASTTSASNFPGRQASSSVHRPRCFGRGDILNKLRQRLNRAAHPLYLVGPAGIGKSALVAELMRTGVASDRDVLRLDARTSASLMQALTIDSLTKRGAMAATDQDMTEIMRDALATLTSSKEALVVFDDVIEPSWLNAVLPETTSAPVLICSRLAPRQSPGGIVMLPPVDPVDSMTILRQDVPTLSNHEVEVLTERLCGVPAALERAAAYMKREKVSAEVCLGRLSRFGIDHTSFIYATEYQESLIGSYSSAWTAANDDRPGSVIAFRVVAAFADSKLPMTLQQSVVSALRESGQVSNIDHVAYFTALRNSALLYQDDDANVFIYRYVQSVLTQGGGQTGTGRREMELAGRALNSVLAADPTSAATFKQNWDLLPHALAFCERASSTPTIDYCDVLRKIGIFSQTICDYPGAILMLAGARVALSSLGLDQSRLYAAVSMDLAGALREVGAYTTAKQIAEEVIAAYDSMQSPENANVALALNNLSLVYLDSGELVDAQSVLVDSIEICEASQHLDELQRAILLNNTGVFWHKMGELERARSNFQEALSLERRLSAGNASMHLATTLANYGRLLADVGEARQARQAMSEVARIITHIIPEGEVRTRVADRLLDGLPI